MTDRKTMGMGLEPHIAAVVCYLPAPLMSLIMLILERHDKDIKFHAWQGTIFGTLFFALIIFLEMLSTYIGWRFMDTIGLFISLLSLFVLLFGFVFWLLCVTHAYKGQLWRLPFIGNMAAKWAGLEE